MLAKEVLERGDCDVEPTAHAGHSRNRVRVAGRTRLDRDERRKPVPEGSPIRPYPRRAAVPVCKRVDADPFAVQDGAERQYAVELGALRGSISDPDRGVEAGDGL